MNLRVLCLLILVSIPVFAETAESADAILANYVAASHAQEQSVRGASMEVQIDAALPRLKKTGKLHALRRISQIGRITYEALKFEGDNTVKNQVINRYLSAEVEAQQGQPSSMAVTPDNYKFKLKNRDVIDGRDVYIFQVTPKQKRQGLFKGDIAIDASTYLRVRESGALVKNPSIFLKKVTFTRDYEILSGVAVLRQVRSVVDTRLVGKAEINIDFTNISVEATSQTAMGLVAGQ